MKKTLILLGLSAYALAAPTLKSRLAQTKARTVEEPPVEAGDDCGCPLELPALELCTAELTEVVGGGVGSTECDQGVGTGYGAAVYESSGEDIVSTPDTLWTSTSESECAACNVGQHASSSCGSRTRTYAISGSIEIAETIAYDEDGCSHEESRGHSVKESATATLNEDNVGTPVQVPGACDCECYEEPDTGVSLPW
jgi:hypothetical protein